MLLPAKITKVEKTIVEVEPSTIYELIENRLGKKYPEFGKISYFARGKAYRYSYTNGHNGNDEYEVARDQTDEDIKLEEFLILVKEILKD